MVPVLRNKADPIILHGSCHGSPLRSSRLIQGHLCLASTQPALLLSFQHPKLHHGASATVGDASVGPKAAPTPCMVLGLFPVLPSPLLHHSDSRILPSLPANNPVFSNGGTRSQKLQWEGVQEGRSCDLTLLARNSRVPALASSISCYKDM